ncbi:MAG TPA: YtxH domain-containing protein [Terriglobales bacterium]|nr:YtxH domain-containing protein [Terriglobales bacterium]
MKNFLAGFGLGWALGILLAPMSGKEIRDDISDRASDLADAARKRYDQVRDVAGKAAQSIRGEAEQKSGTQAS